MNPLRVGIVGAGLMGRWHGEAARRTGAVVTCVADVTPGMAQSLAARHRGAFAFSSLDDLLTGMGNPVDVLHLCTPAETHGALIRKALVAGVHVLAEKPLTPRAGETESLMDAAVHSGVIVCPVHQFLFQEGVQRVLGTVPSLGRVVHVEAVFCSAGAEPDGTDARRDAVAADILPHPLSLLARFLPAGLDGAGDWCVHRPAAGEFRVWATGGAGGATAAVLVSLEARPTHCALTLFGTAGTAHMDLFHGYAFFEQPAVSRLRKVTGPFDRSLRCMTAAGANLGRRALLGESAYPGLRALTAAFYRAVRGGPTPIPVAETLAVARLRDRLLGSLPGFATSPLSATLREVLPL